MALLSYRSQYTDGRVNVPVCESNEVRSCHATVTIAANPSANDTVHMIDLPKDHVPVLCILDSADLDTNVAPTITISAGALNANKTDLATTWVSSSNVAQSGIATDANGTRGTFVEPAVANGPLSVGLKFPNAAATFAAGVVGLTVNYRRADPTGA